MLRLVFKVTWNKLWGEPFHPCSLLFCLFFFYTSVVSSYSKCCQEASGVLRCRAASDSEFVYFICFFDGNAVYRVHRVLEKSLKVLEKSLNLNDTYFENFAY